MRKRKKYEKKRSGNVVEIKGDIAIVYTSKGEQILIDEEDISKIKGYTWWRDGRGYAVTQPYDDNSKRFVLFMHRLILDVPEGKTIDHINHIPTDNRKSNLRICTQQQNCWNTKMRNHNTSGVIGVNWHKHKNQWQTRIMLNGKSISLGYYDDITKAARVRRNAELKYFGEFAFS